MYANHPPGYWSTRMSVVNKLVTDSQASINILGNCSKAI